MRNCKESFANIVCWPEEIVINVKKALSRITSDIPTKALFFFMSLLKCRINAKI